MIKIAIILLLMTIGFTAVPNSRHVDNPTIQINQYLRLFQQESGIELTNGLTLLVPDTKCHNCRDFCLKYLDECQIKLQIFITNIITTAIDLKTNQKRTGTLLYFDKSYALNGFKLGNDNMILVNLINGKVKDYTTISIDENIDLAYTKFVGYE